MASLSMATSIGAAPREWPQHGGIMMNRFRIRACAGGLGLLLVTGAGAMEHHGNDRGMGQGQAETRGMDMSMGMMRADAHAPFGVMGADRMMPGKVMLSYRYMRMEMDGNRIGTDKVSPEEIITSVANRFAPPPKLRVVPTAMTTDMHMIGAMYAPSTAVTLVAMGTYLEKRMDHVTFQGGSGTTRLGTFTTESSGFGDTKLAGLVRLYDRGGHELHLNAGLSLPTGSIDESDDVLSPMGTRPELRLPYPMQLGSGTYDLIPGLTYKGASGRLGWGAQALGTLRLGENDEDYSLGDRVDVTAWGSYRWAPWMSTSLRISGRHIGRIDGRDPKIAAPVQTADPDFQGGERVDVSVGVNLAGQGGGLAGVRVGMELGVPVYQDLNGPQMAGDWSLNLTGKYMF